LLLQSHARTAVATSDADAMGDNKLGAPYVCLCTNSIFVSGRQHGKPTFLSVFIFFRLLVQLKQDTFGTQKKSIEKKFDRIQKKEFRIKNNTKNHIHPLHRLLPATYKNIEGRDLTAMAEATSIPCTACLFLQCHVGHEMYVHYMVSFALPFTLKTGKR
jgi:hypothetical protein